MNEHENVIGDGLLEAISQVMQVVSAGARDPATLRRSFRSVAAGLGAEHAFLARVGAPPDTLDVVESCGLSGHDLQAVRVGRSAPGLSTTVVQRVLTHGRTQYIHDSRSAEGIERTLAFLDFPCSVICAPVRDAHTRLPLAVLYFQTSSSLQPLPEHAVPHVDAYATALGVAWGAMRRPRRERSPLHDELDQARAAVGSTVVNLVGRSQQTERLRHLLRQVVVPAMAAPHPDPVLILGPTGSGKEVVARYLHRHSSRAHGRFMALNCATFKGEILEAKLFGHVKGSFTGAGADAEGLFIAANGGVLFLDEVGDMPEDGQVMLLRALETRTVRPVGGRDERPVDALVMCATNVELERAVQTGRFRSDLYHRINGLTVRVSPLAERREDVRPLLAHYLALHERRLGKSTQGLTADALATLERYDWPDNVRELSRACSTLILHAEPEAPLDMSVLARALPQVIAALAPGALRPGDPASPFERDYGSFDGAMGHFARLYLTAIERKFQGNRTAMASYLGASRSRLYRLLVRHGLYEPGQDPEADATLDSDDEDSGDVALD